MVLKRRGDRSTYELPGEFVGFIVFLLTALVVVNICLIFNFSPIASLDSTTSDALLFLLLAVILAVCFFLVVVLRGRMLAELEIKQEKLITTARWKERFRRTIDCAPIGMAIMTVDGRFVYGNRVLCSALGVSDKELKSLWLRELLHPDTVQSVIESLEQVPNGGVSRWQFESPMFRRDGKTIDAIVSVSVLPSDPEEEQPYFVVQIEDVTEQRQAQRQVHYLSIHDRVTGLYNRTFFEDKLTVLNQETYLPLSIVYLDLNSLKLINDAFGHEMGDRLLVQTAQVLRQVCGERYTPARLGGDEFAVILPRTSESEAAAVCAAIKRGCEAGKEPLDPNVAIGVATRTSMKQSLEDVLKEAEDRMYTNKLVQGKGIRSSILASLQKTLAETTYETEEHARRLQALAQRLGQALGLSNAELDRLALLAVLHDIGKVAVPNTILMKPGPLLPEEWEIMRKHPEIGFRIAQSAPELSHVAEEILCHHECWDGTGYPRGLAGEEIPLLARVIALVDAYDVMTHERAYKRAMTRSEAIAELKRCAGKQFDPGLVEVFVRVLDEQEKKGTVIPLRGFSSGS